MPRTTFAAGRRRPTYRSTAAEIEPGLDRRDPGAHALDLGGKRSGPGTPELVREREHPLREPVVLAQEIALPMLQVSELRRQSLRVRKPFDRHALSIGGLREDVKSRLMDDELDPYRTDSQKEWRDWAAHGYRKRYTPRSMLWFGGVFYTRLAATGRIG